MSEQEILNDSLLALTDRLCRIPSYAGFGCNEEALARVIAQLLGERDWLTVVLDEVAPGRFNVLAFDGPAADIELLVAGHIDTVLPVHGWTVPEHHVQDGRYHALGAADAKAAIAAALDAIAQVGPTRGVGYLFYCDEEYNFLGMKHFIEEHAEIRPQCALSLCGPPAQFMISCRSLIEFSIVVYGHGGHASRHKSGRSAVTAAMDIITDLQAWCAGMESTTCNVGGLHAGSQSPGADTEVPNIVETANRIADVAWLLVEIRSQEAISAVMVRSILDRTVARINHGFDMKISLGKFDIRLDMPGYDSAPADVETILEAFSELHRSHSAPADETGYLDISLICQRGGTGGVCMGPEKGNAHGPDEWVDIESLRTYREGVVRLLSNYAVSSHK